MCTSLERDPDRAGSPLIAAKTPLASPAAGDGLQMAEETVLLVADPGGEEEGGVKIIVGVAAKGQAPQPVNGDDAPVGRDERADEGAGAGIKSVDPPISKVADEQLLAERTKTRRRESQAPGRVEWRSGMARNETGEGVGAGIEEIDVAVARSLHVVMLCGVLPGKGDDEGPAQVLDPKRGEAGRESGVGE